MALRDISDVITIEHQSCPRSPKPGRQTRPNTRQRRSGLTQQHTCCGKARPDRSRRSIGPWCVLNALSWPSFEASSVILPRNRAPFPLFHWCQHCFQQ